VPSERANAALLGAQAEAENRRVVAFLESAECAVSTGPMVKGKNRFRGRVFGVAERRLETEVEEQFGAGAIVLVQTRLPIGSVIPLRPLTNPCEMRRALNSLMPSYIRLTRAHNSPEY
jgi:hypothetical protein